MNTRYIHTNIVALDYRSLADFYIAVFGCEEKPPHRDLSGSWLDEATDLSGAHIRGVHLLLPGHGSGGPTLEIFQYENGSDAGEKCANREGFAHIAFSVEDVGDCIKRIYENGGSLLGEMVTTEVEGSGTITFAYARDPEDNIVEIQSWG
ncbi:MAG: VOC family protein [Spirochaetota bacterium]